MQSQVGFNRVPKKVPEKVWEALVQSQVRINGFREDSGEGLGGFVAEQGQFQQGSREGSGEGLGGFGAEPGQFQQGSREGSGEGLGGFGAEPGQAQQGFGESSGEDSGKLWCKAKSGSTGFRRRFRRRSGRLPEKVLEALVQSQVKLNRVLERLIRAPESGSLRAPWDHLEHQKSGSLRAPENHIFRVTLGDTGLGHGVRHSNLIIFLSVLQTQALHCSFMISYRSGGVGWGNNVHVPVQTQAQQPHHLSCCPADTGTALLFHDQLPVGWGGVGWGNNVHVPVHTQARRSCYVVTSSSSDLQDVPDTL